MTDHLRVSIITGAACCLGTALALALGLNNPYWATMTAWSMTALPGRKLGLARAMRQIFATAVGCLLGYQFGLHAEGRPALQWLGVFLFTGVGTYMRFQSPYYYAWGLGSFSSIMLVAITFYNPSVLRQDAFYRGAEILCGVAGVMLAQLPVTWVLERIWPRSPGPPVPPPPTMLDARDSLHIALVGALTVSSVPIIWRALHLPVGSLLITMIAPLVALDVVFISSPIRSHWRLLGSLLGGVVGIAASAVAADSYFVWTLLLFGGLAASAWVRGGHYPWSISGMQLGLSYMFAQVTGSGPTADVSVVIDRIAGLVFGLIVMIVVAYYVRLFFQDRPVEEMPRRLRLA